MRLTVGLLCMENSCIGIYRPRCKAYGLVFTLGNWWDETFEIILFRSITVYTYIYIPPLIKSCDVIMSSANKKRLVDAGTTVYKLTSGLVARRSCIVNFDNACYRSPRKIKKRRCWVRILQRSVREARKLAIFLPKFAARHSYDCGE